MSSRLPKSSYHHSGRTNTNDWVGAEDPDVSQMDAITILSDINEINTALNEISENADQYNETKRQSGGDRRWKYHEQAQKPLWNSLTGSYNGTPLKTRSSEGRKLDNFHDSKGFDGDDVRRRVVKFAEQLEDDTVPVFSSDSTPRKTAKPILREQKRGLPSIDTRTTIDDFSKENLFNARDPTPCSAEKKMDAPSIDEPSQSHQEPRMMQFSPSERHSASANRNAPYGELERNTAATPVNRSQRSSDQWNVAEIFSPDQRASKQREPSSEKSLRIGTLALSPGPNSIEVSAMPSTQADWTMTLPSNSVGPLAQENENVDQFDDTWRVLAPSPSESSEETATAYLINKYTNKNKSVAPSERGRKVWNDSWREKDDSMLLSPKVRTSSKSPEQSPQANNKASGRKPAKASNSSHASSRRRQNQKKNASYSALEDDYDSFVEEVGTELVWMKDDGIPKHISVDYGDEETASPVFRTKRSIISDFLSRRPTDKPKSPVAPAIAEEEKDLHVKSTGSETDDSASGTENHQVLRSGWDKFDEASDQTGDDYDQLLPPRGMSTKRKKCFIRSVLALILVGSIAGIGVYLTTVLPKEKFDVGSSACSKGGDDFAYSQRYIQIRDIILTADNTDGFLVDTAQSPQRKSLCWVADFDGLELDSAPSNSDAIVQRYALGVIFFSLANQEGVGLRETNFLSDQHECGWENVMCSVSTSVTALLLADMNLEGMLPREISHLSRLCKSDQSMLLPILTFSYLS